MTRLRPVFILAAACGIVLVFAMLGTRSIEPDPLTVRGTLRVRTTNLAEPSYEQRLYDEVFMRVLANMAGPGLGPDSEWRVRCAKTWADEFMRLRNTPEIGER